MAAEHKAAVLLERGDQDFLDKKYGRANICPFYDSCDVPGSCPPSKLISVPLAKSDAVDPEEGLVASLSPCQMLFFLAFAAKEGYRVDAYIDEAVEVLGQNERCRTFIELITVRPEVMFSGYKRPTADAIAGLHHDAHDNCFVSNWLRSEIVIDPPEPEFV